MFIESSHKHARLFIAEHLVPGLDEPHFSETLRYSYDVCSVWKGKDNR